MSAPESRSSHDGLAATNTDLKKGLTQQEGLARATKFGRNVLAESESNKWMDLAKAFWGALSFAPCSALACLKRQNNKCFIPPWRLCVTGPMPAMIWAAIVVEAVIASTGEPKEWGDFGVLMVLQVLNSVIGWHEDQKAGDAVAALKAALKAKATVLRDGKWDTVNRHPACLPRPLLANSCSKFPPCPRCVAKLSRGTLCLS